MGCGSRSALLGYRFALINVARDRQTRQPDSLREHTLLSSERELSGYSFVIATTIFAQLILQSESYLVRTDTAGWLICDPS